MKKTVALLVSLILILSSALAAGFTVPAVGTELYSCGFESGEESEFVTSSTCTNKISTENVHGGSYCLELTPSASDQKIFRKKIAVSSGKDYTVSFWYRGKPNWAYVRVVFDSDVDSQMYFIKSDDMLNEWVYGEMHFNTGKYDSIDLIFGTSGTGYNFFLDDIKIAESTAIETDPDNLFPDGSFENGSLDDWEIINRVAVISNFNPHTGSYSMKMNAIGDSNGYPRAMKTVTVEPNTNYTFSFWFSGSAGQQQCVIRDINNKDIVDTDYLKISYETDFKATQSHYSYTFNSGNNTKVKLGVRSAAAREFYVDDFCLKKAKPVEEKPGELVENGGFEQNGQDWYIEPKGRVFETDNAHSGEKAFYIQPDENYQLVLKKVTLKKNTDYTFSFWYRGTPGWAQYYVRPTGGASIAKDTFLGSGDEVTEWTKVTVPFNSGNETSYQVGVMTGGVSYPFWLDDVSVVEGTDKPSEEEGELVENGGFEQNGQDWYIEPKGRVFETDNAHGGEKAFYIQPDENYQLVLKKVTLKKNTDYTLSFWYRGTPGWAQYYVRPTGGASIAKDTFLGSGDEVTEWTKVIVYFNSGNETSYQVGVMTGGVSYPFWLDDVSVVEGKVEPEEQEDGELVENGGFEQNGDGWYIEPKGRVFETDNPHGGKKAFYIQPDETYQLVLKKVTLKKNTDYTFSFWYRGTPGWAQYVVRPTGGASIAKDLFFNKPDEVEKWTYFSVSFKTGEETSYQVGVMTSGINYPFWLDDVNLAEGIVEPPTEPEVDVSVPTLVEDMPMYIPGTWVKSKYMAPADKNMLVNADFESNGGIAFDKYVTVTDEEYAVHSGEKGAEFRVKGDGTAILLMNVEKNTEYLFGMWIRNKQYSADNTNTLVWGISAPGSKELALKRAFPAGDGVWHLVGYSFNSQDNEQVALNIIGKDTSLYFDDMFLCKVTDMVRYIAPEEALTPATASNETPTLTGCDEKDNQFENYDLSDEKDTFWSDVKGSVFGNQLTIDSTGSDVYGNALHYCVGKASNGKERPTGAFYIRRVAVEPNTDYTFSALYSLVKPSVDTGVGTTYFGFIDTNREAPTGIKSFIMDKTVYLENHAWQTATATFHTGDYHEIAFVILDCGGEFYLDDLRLFKTENAKELEEKKDDFSIKKLSSKYYSAKNGIISGISDGMKVNELIGKFDNSKYLTVYDKNGDRLKAESLISTGDELRLMNGPVIVDRVTLAVRGDVDGNGTVDMEDVKQIHSMLVGEIKLSDLEMRAADYNEDGTVDIYDTVQKYGKPGTNGKTTLSLIPPENIETTSTFDVYLTVKGGLTAMSGKLRFDNTHMILRKAVPCDETAWSFTYAYGDNEVLFAITNNNGRSADGKLLKLTFETDTVTDGIPNMTFRDLIMTDGINKTNGKNVSWSYRDENSSAKNQGTDPSKESFSPETETEYITETITETEIDEADNNYLKSLVVEETEISPEFDPENKSYTATVPFTVKEVTVKAEPQTQRATVSINDTKLKYVGKNIVKVVVHSESGLKRTYKIHITRQDKEKSANLAKGTFPWLWVGIASGAIVILGGAVLLIVKKRKKV